MNDWFESADEVAAVIDRAVLSGLVEPLRWYPFPVAFEGATAAEMKLVDYICWKAECSPDGTASLDSREAFVFAGLGGRYSETKRLLVGDKRVLGQPFVKQVDDFRHGELFRCRLPWRTQVPAAGVIMKPGGLLWHRWLALLPTQMVTLRAINGLLHSRGRRQALSWFRRGLRRQYGLNDPATHKVTPEQRDRALHLLIDELRLLERSAVALATPEAVEPDPRARPAVTVRLVAERFQHPFVPAEMPASFTGARDLSAAQRSAIRIGNPRA